MAQARLRLIILAAAALWLNPSMGHLTGVLSHTIEDPEWLTAVITNKGARHVSVLKHNTIFDTSHPSMPCRITDAAGDLLPMGGSHVMYSGIGNSDLLDLAPGGNFTRHLNLSDYIHLEKPSPELSMTFVVSLPSTVQGLTDHDGSYQIHPDALSDTSGPQLRMGDPLKANLTQIPIHSKPLRVTLHEALHQPRNGIRPRQLFNGIGIPNNNQCSDAQVRNMSEAILYSSYLAVAAKGAASDFEHLPFNYFFPATLEAANTVGAAMDKVVAAQLRQGNPVAATCNDVYDLCGPKSPGGGAKLGYALFSAATHGFIPRVVMCANGLSLPNNIWPCSGLPGVVSKAYVFLHELMHIESISGLAAEDFRRPNNYQSARSVNVDVVAGKDTTMDAVALAMSGSWAWEVGLGDGPWSGQPCVQNFLLGNLDSILTVDGMTLSG
ncbi:hypothetical protein MMC24_007421 [Lignoscripta atroalba]|nr:hypothetical protein [Lignoscripta atroalba]